jgi:hypothetical protein
VLPQREAQAGAFEGGIEIAGILQKRLSLGREQRRQTRSGHR